MKIVPRGWAEFQHYKDRNPPWIRLHRSLLDNYEFQCLPVASRALAPMLWLLASEAKEGVIDAAPAKLAFRLRQSEKEVVAALKPLIDNAFFVLYQSASNSIAPRLRDAVPETEAEALQSQREPTALVGGAAPDPYRVPPCDYESIAAGYAELLPQLPQIAVMSDARKGHINARWRELCAAEKFTQAQAVEWFRDFFAHVGRSRFLTGAGPPRKNQEGVWRADFDWLMLPTNFVKVVEGRYDTRRTA